MPPVRFIFLAFFPFLSMLSYADAGCMKNARSEEEINICQHAEAKRLEMELKDLEAAIQSRFQSPQLERFQAAQAFWMQMTEKDCEIEADFYEGAPIYPAIKSQCLQKHYRNRIQLVRDYLCPEYSLSNGCEKSRIEN